MDDELSKSALEYHRLPRPGKLAVEPTKRMASQRDLALAYSPGVASPCLEIAADPSTAHLYTARGNLIGVISNGTAVLGLGNIGPLASKPVMEGKVVLFKKFAGIDAFDLEVDALDVDSFVNTVAALEPTFGGINLEDIKAPECFEIEAKLRARMSIPVFHDDQHGTAIVCAAAVMNVLHLRGKRLEDVKLVTSGAGAAAMACVQLLVTMGLKRENVTLTDIDGVVHSGRENLHPMLARFARQTDARTLGEVLEGADVFMGLSAPRVFKREWLPLMAPNPLILALANPEPEILPEFVHADRPDAIIATGRSDYANQVNNVLCFPFIFRGALDVGATTINTEMEAAAVQAIAALAREPVADDVAAAYGGTAPVFGPDYIIPKPFDPRLILHIAPAVAKAAMDSGVATRPITDMQAYRDQLEQFVYRAGQLMRPIFAKAKKQRPRVVIAEGEDDRTLRALDAILAEGLAHPVLIGSRDVIASKLGVGMQSRSDHFSIIDPATDTEQLSPMLSSYQALICRRGVSPEAAARAFATRPGVAAAMLLRARQVDGALVGGVDDWHRQMTEIMPLIERRPDVSRFYALTAMVLPTGSLFACDTHLNIDPTVDQLVEMSILAADAVRQFGLDPVAAFLSHSSFGASRAPSALKMRDAVRQLRARAPDFAFDGEMHADAALVETIRRRLLTDCEVSRNANLLIMPNLDAANIAVTLLVAAAEGLLIGPILLGSVQPIHILTPTTTARGIVNLAAMAAASVRPD